MDAKQVLEQVRSGAISVEDAEQFFRRAPYEELGYAKLDTHRKLRSGFGEVVFCSGKADEFLSSIFENWPPKTVRYWAPVPRPTSLNWSRPSAPVQCTIPLPAL